VKQKVELISVIVQAEKKTEENEKVMKETVDQLACERDAHSKSALEAVKLKKHTLDVSPVARACNQSGTIVFGPTTSVELVGVTKLAHGSKADQTKSSCENATIMAVHQCCIKQYIK